MTENPPETSARGFLRFPPIEGAYGGHVEVYESSAASEPRLWLNAVNSADPRETSSPGTSATIHLSLAAARALVGQLEYLIENHYQVKPR